MRYRGHSVGWVCAWLALGFGWWCCRCSALFSSDHWPRCVATAQHCCVVLLAKASAHSTKEMRLHDHIMGVNSYANHSVGFSNINRELKQQGFWVTHVNRKWTFCFLGQLGLVQTLRRIICIREKTLSNPYLYASLPVDMCHSKTSFNT